MKQINTSPITQYIQILKAAELSQQREIRIPIQQARMISMTLVELLEAINTDYDAIIRSLAVSVPEPVGISMDGGSL